MYIVDDPWMSGWISRTSLHVGQCIYHHCMKIVFMCLTAEEIDGGMVVLLGLPLRTWLECLSAVQ